MGFDFHKIEIANRVGWIELNHPPVNAANWEMLREHLEVFEHVIANQEVRVVVLASALEKYFSAGADLRVLESFDADKFQEWVTICHRIVGVLRNSPKPLLAAIHGTAVGGGLEMTLHCDLRFAASDARLGQPEINIAFIPPVGATQALVRLIGRSKAIKYLYDGSIVTAAQAHEIGLVDVLSEPSQLRSDVQGYAEQLAAKPSGALASIRRCITIGGDLAFDEGLVIEREEAIALAAAADFSEGVSAFLDKRDPVWK